MMMIMISQIASAPDYIYDVVKDHRNSVELKLELRLWRYDTAVL
jgi:hypothetical protein